MLYMKRYAYCREIVGLVRNPAVVKDAGGDSVVAHSLLKELSSSIEGGVFVAAWVGAVIVGGVVYGVYEQRYSGESFCGSDVWVAK